VRPTPFKIPEWNAAPQPDKKLLVVYEQGFGDTLQFVRYLPIVRSRVGQIQLLCPPQLRRLLEGTPGADILLVDGKAVPDADLQAPLASLPLVMRTTVDTIPAAIPYIMAPPEEVVRWKARLGEGFKIGLVWCGNPSNKRDALRSCRLADFAPLAEIPDVRFLTLQVGPGSEQAQSPPAGLALEDFTEHIKDFADTAGLLANLDLVVAVDTAVVHLAGAMGVPTFTLIDTANDWRWMVEREETPWYPGMRLFRQKTRGDWADVVERVKQRILDLRRPT